MDFLATKLCRKITERDVAARIQTRRGDDYPLKSEMNTENDNEPGVRMTGIHDSELEIAPILDVGQLAQTLDSTEDKLHVEFYAVFLEHINAQMEQLDGAHDSPDTARAIAHQLKSSSQSIGTPRLTQALLAIEAIAISEDADTGSLRTALQKARDVWHVTDTVIEERMADLTSS